METWKILLITIISAVVLGCVLGVVIGRHQLKKARSDYKPLLTVKERVIYLLCIAVGAGCVLTGIFHTFPSPVPEQLTPEDGIVEDGLAEDEGGIVYGANPVIVDTPARAVFRMG